MSAETPESGQGIDFVAPDTGDEVPGAAIIDRVPGRPALEAEINDTERAPVSYAPEVTPDGMTTTSVEAGDVGAANLHLTRLHGEGIRRAGGIKYPPANPFGGEVVTTTPDQGAENSGPDIETKVHQQ